MIELDNDTFFPFVGQLGVVVVEFAASWCFPCQQMLRILPPLIEELQYYAQFGKLDIDKSPLPPMIYHVRKYPTFIFFKDGKEMDRGNVMLLRDIKKKIMELQ